MTDVCLVPPGPVSPLEPARCLRSPASSGVGLMIVTATKRRVLTECQQLLICILFTWHGCSTTRNDKRILSGRIHFGPKMSKSAKLSAVSLQPNCPGVARGLLTPSILGSSSPGAELTAFVSKSPLNLNRGFPSEPACPQAGAAEGGSYIWIASCGCAASGLRTARLV